jgi:hypothetical protein
MDIKNAYYIKLGAKGAWETISIHENIACIGYHYLSLEEINGRNWNEIKGRDWRGEHKSKAVQTADINILAKFVDSTPEDIWITFYGGYLWWCRLESSPVEYDLSRNIRFRRVLGNWSNYNAKGGRLYLNQIPGIISKIQMYRGTVCSVHKEEADVLSRLLDGEPSENYLAIQEARRQLAVQVQRGFSSLHWKDFEILVDMIFRNAGWRRISMLGSVQKGLDLELEEPVTGERFMAQVKSRASQADLKEFIDEFAGDKYQRLYFIVHSPQSALHTEQDNVELWSPQKLAEMAVDLGLTGWIMQKSY